MTWPEAGKCQVLYLAVMEDICYSFRYLTLLSILMMEGSSYLRIPAFQNRIQNLASSVTTVTGSSLTVAQPVLGK